MDETPSDEELSKKADELWERDRLKIKKIEEQRTAGWPDAPEALDNEINSSEG